VQQFNVHPSTINRLLSRFRVTRQVSAHRRQLTTAVRRDSCIVTTLRRNRLVSASKVASELHPTSGVWISDQGVKNRLLRDVNLRVRRPRVAVHLTSSSACCLGNHPSTPDSAAIDLRICLLMSRFHVDFADGCACVWRGRIERFHPKNVIQHNRYDDGIVVIWDNIMTHRLRQS
jgi:hypothetical protein